MCSFGSCQTRFEFLSQFRKVRNAFECFVTQVQTHLPKTKRVWPMKINVICTVRMTFFVARFCKMVNFGPIKTKFGTTVYWDRRYYVVIGAIKLILWSLLW